MTFKRDIVLDRLAALKKTIKLLKELSQLSRDDFSDEKQQWSAERGLQVAAESFFDIGNHILVGQFEDRPSNYEEIITQLANRKVISEDLSTRLKGLGGFRNILVHDYMELDFDKVYDRLQNGLPDFENLCRELAEWLEKADFLAL